MIRTITQVGLITQVWGLQAQDPGQLSLLLKGGRGKRAFKLAEHWVQVGSHRAEEEPRAVAGGVRPWAGRLCC